MLILSVQLFTNELLMKKNSVQNMEKREIIRKPKDNFPMENGIYSK